MAADPSVAQQVQAPPLKPLKLKSRLASAPAGQPKYSLTIKNAAGDGNDVTLTRTFNAPPSMISPLTLSNGVTVLNGSGFSNAPYFIEATTNLNPPIPWQTISTNTSDTNGVYQFIDIDSTNFPIRFYRVRSP